MTGTSFQIGDLVVINYDTLPTILRRHKRVALNATWDLYALAGYVDFDDLMIVVEKTKFATKVISPTTAGWIRTLYLRLHLSA